MLRFALTILLSAFLLFQVQPLIARFILPWFGGSPAVWNTCLLFFQLLLLLGYFYAHLVSSKLKPRTQGGLHLGLLALSLVLLPIIPSQDWQPSGEENPVIQILLLLTATVGVPYFLLSTTGPLVQSWFAIARPGASPYRLYSLSNIGSLAALLTYPLLVEPFLRLGTQAVTWSVCYGLFVLLCGSCAWQLFRQPAMGSQQEGEFAEAAGLLMKPEAVEDRSSEPAVPEVRQPDSPLRVWEVLFWLLLATAPSAFLLATTNQLCQEVAVVPFLWILPLIAYLLSFIIAFDSPRWYIRPLWFVVLLVTVVLMIYALIQGSQFSISGQIAACTAAFFACAMCCHGELAASRPRVKYLTLYYLVIATGGALGGLLVVIVAPLVFTHYWEFYVGLVFCVAVVFLAYVRLGIQYQLPRRAWMVCIGIALLALLGITQELVKYAAKFQERLIARTRSFYGVVSVRQDSNKLGELKLMYNGRTEHGFQYTAEPESREPTGYYGPDSGVGAAILLHPRRQAATDQAGKLRIGVIGLGVGTLAAYGQAGDVVRFYEINPQVEDFANSEFTYLKESAAEVSVVLGDGRLSLERELKAAGSQKYDVLVIDAFSSDAIPMHLLTRESLALYRQHLQPDGILAFHITNHYLDLSPVLFALAEDAGWQAAVLKHLPSADNLLHAGSTWVLLTAEESFFKQSHVKRRATRSPLSKTKSAVWTDDYGSLLHILK